MSDEEEKTEEEIAQEDAAAAFSAAMPPPGPFFAARVTDMHICPMVTGVVPHVGGPILPVGCPTVLIGNMPAARVGDMLTCAGPPDVIVKGSPTVLIGGMPAARFMDTTSHGGMIVTGFPTVIIGNSGGGSSSPGTVPPTSGAGSQNSGDHESCFSCRQHLAEQGALSSDPAVQQAAADMDRLNHDYEHAKLANGAYDGTAPPGWDVVTDPDELAAMGLDPSDLNQPGSEFQAVVYRPDPDVFGDEMTTTIAFRGSQNPLEDSAHMEDWKNNLQQGLGMDSDYYENAVGIGNAVGRSGQDVEFAGHSLGGGLASAASQASGNDATTFNSAGLNSDTVSDYGGTPQASDVNAYRVEDEILTGIQEGGSKSRGGGALAGAVAGFFVGGPLGALIGGAAGYGAVRGLNAAAPDAIGTKYDLPGSGNPGARHGMQQVLDAMEDQIVAKEEFLEDALGIECDC